MITIEKLALFGADVEQGLSRCMGNEEFYLRLVSSIPEETSFDRLQSGLEKGDLVSAFEAAHALKGVLGNLALTPLYQQISEITELLRNRTEMDYSELLDNLLKKKEELGQL